MKPKVLFLMVIASLFLVMTSYAQSVHHNPWIAANQTPHNLDIACRHNGQYYYFNKRDFQYYDREIMDFHSDVVGIVVDDGDQAFILAYDYEDGEYTWKEAVKKFGDQLPTVEQARAWMNQAVEIYQIGCQITGLLIPNGNEKYASQYYGSHLPFSFWTRTSAGRKTAYMIYYETCSVGTVEKDIRALVYTVLTLPAGPQR